MDFKSDGEIDLKLYGVVGRNFRGRKAFGRVGNTGFEPNRMHVSAAFGSHRFRVELSSVAVFCITDQASVTMVARWSRMGNTAHPLPTRKFGSPWLATSHPSNTIFAPRPEPTPLVPGH